MLLADMGADVIKVESVLLGDPARLAPPFDGDESVAFASVNRNKRSLAVNYRKADGREIIHQLARTSDVFVEVFKPGQAARLGLDYAALAALNPRLIYCSLSGYGQTGPYAQRSGHDASFLALTGALDLLRDGDGRPQLPGFQLADVAGGGLFAALAILAALYERSVTGQGQYLDLSIAEGAASLVAFQSAIVLAAGDQGRAALANLQGSLHTYHIYETRDGQYMSLAALEPVLWADFCRAVEREDLAAQYMPASDEQRSQLLAEVSGIFSQRTRAEWEAFLAERDLCCEPVLTIEEASVAYGDRLGRPLLRADQASRPLLGSIPSPLGLAGPQISARPAPRLGEHTIQILSDLDLSAAEIEALRARKTIATADDVVVRRLKGVQG
jgi:crotonobetainyl-CoA:carnitine CoA-transferase CaiB-like acyl-CoA transferase